MTARKDSICLDFRVLRLKSTYFPPTNLYQSKEAISVRSLQQYIHAYIPLDDPLLFFQEL